MQKRNLRVVDLFCGAGGLSLGFQRAGFEISLAIDNNRNAVETYRSNLGNHVETFDLTASASDLTTLNADVIVGGPPCQGFSSAGLRKVNDDRNSLVSIFAQIIAINRPQAFVFENVEGFLTAEQGKRLFELLTPLIEAGYHIHLQKINAANFGVPQHRKRVIVIGGLGWSPNFPAFTHSAYGAPGAQLAGQGLTPTPTLINALAGLPIPSTKSPGIPQGHYYRPLQGLELERAIALKPGQIMRDLPVELQHFSYQHRANRRVMDGTPTEKRGGAPIGIRRLQPDEPSKAITGGAISEFIHPYENRPLTIRECARLQTFPDEFLFCSNQASQIQLIGNAVPPRLAEVIAFTLAQDLYHHQLVTDNIGKLLSFVPTLSSGLSPVLKNITNEINQKFGVGDQMIQTRFPWD